MLTKLISVATALAFMTQAYATTVAAGTITQVAAGVDVLGVYISANSNSPCPSGWFYSLTSDSNDASMNRILAALMTSWQTGATVALYGVTVACNQGTNSRFTSITASTN